MPPAKEKNLSKLALINALKKCPPNARCQLINFLNSQGIQVLSESIFNVLFNNAPLTKSEKSRIKKQCSKGGPAVQPLLFFESEVGVVGNANS